MLAADGGRRAAAGDPQGRGEVGQCMEQLPEWPWATAAEASILLTAARSIADAIATAAFGAVQRLVGLLEHILGPGEVLAALGQPYANRY